MWLRVNENVYCKWQQPLQNTINIYSYLAKPKPPDRETSSSTFWPKTSSVVPTVYVLYSLVVCIIYYTYNYTHLSIQHEFNPKHEDIVVFMVLLTCRSLTTGVRFTDWSKFTFYHDENIHHIFYDEVFKVKSGIVIILPYKKDNVRSRMKCEM